MNIKTKKIIAVISRIIIAMIVIAGIFYVFISDQDTCTNIQINIKDINGDYLITEKQVNQKIKKGQKEILGKTFKDIDLKNIENIISESPYVQKATAVAGIDGVLKINIIQREPIARITNNKGESFYLTSDDKLIPLSNTGAIRVPLVNGNIEAGLIKNKTRNLEDLKRPSEKQKFKDLKQLLQNIKDNEFSRSYIQQIIIEPNMKFSLIGIFGYHKIELGKVDNSPEKLIKLEKFYTKGLSQTGWDKYDKINLEFSNQIVCTPSNKID